jgi:hypothetical protein
MNVQNDDVLLLARGRIRCRRCSARSKRTEFVRPSLIASPASSQPYPRGYPHLRRKVPYFASTYYSGRVFR